MSNGQDAEKKFVDLGEFNEKDVDLTAMPTNAVHYLQQVIVGRKKAAAVVSAKMEECEANLASSAAVIPEEPSISAKCEFIPCKEWRKSRLEMFTKCRERMVALKSQIGKPIEVTWPAIGKRSEWKEAILTTPYPGIDLKTQKDEHSLYGEHKGTPPLVSVLFSLKASQIDNLIEMLSEWYLEDGYSRPLFQWLFAVLVLIEEPLHADTCCALRDIVKEVRIQRCTLPEEDQELIREMTYIIVIIAEYFSQRDLMDL